jgi:hypothetical protein
MSQSNNDCSNNANASSRDEIKNEVSLSSSQSQPQSQLLNWSMLDDPSIIEYCRNSLRDEGVMVLKDFTTQYGLNKLKEEIISVPYSDIQKDCTPWQDQGDYINYSSSHPRNFMMKNVSAAFVGRKTLENDTNDRFCMSIYNDSKNEKEKENNDKNDENDSKNNEENNDERLLQFLSSVADTKLYKSKDDNGSVYSYRIHPNHNAPWHFDESPYTAILYLQNTEEGCGGEFEYVPWCRPTSSKDDVKGHEIVKTILMSSDDVDENNEDKAALIKRINVEPGSLIFFNGSRTFHRAAPITGPTIRIGLVFTYSDIKGFMNSDDVKDNNKWDPVDATATDCLIEPSTKK